MLAEPEQAEIVAFLSRGAAYGDPALPVDRITTHISHLFLAGERAYKLKRAVRLPYVDFSTVALRHAACERELALNRRLAPELYEAVVPVTRAAGGYALGGSGEAADWVVRMRRFDQDCLLDRIAEQGGLAPSLLRALGDVVAQAHASAEPVMGAGAAAALERVIRSNGEAFAACPRDVFAPGAVDRLQTSCAASLRTVAPLLDRRRAQGRVRRCHGDLHLGNICLIGGRPVLFDCIEFSDDLAVIDVLYDLAFVLMDLWQRGLSAEANLVFNRYLDRADEADGLSALPLFMALRAAIRAHVTATGGKASRLTEARSYLDLALDLLEPASPSLIAIGGLSGTGKSTLAYRLAPETGRAPGARVLRSDVVRKRLFGLPPEQRLGSEGYTQEVTRKVYNSLIREARRLLESGQAVIVDAVSARPEERSALRAMAEAAGVPFTGLWLEAPRAILEHRVGDRTGDASDADMAVLRRQLDYDLGPIDWTLVDVSGSIEDAAGCARRVISRLDAGPSDRPP